MKNNVACLCTLASIQNVVCKKWGILLLIELYNHKGLRYHYMMQNFYGISPSTLTLLLKQLQEEDLIKRQILDEITTKIEYTITRKGKKFLDVIIPILEWIKSQKDQEVHDSFSKCKQ